LRYGNFTSDKWEAWHKNPLKLFDGVKGMEDGFLKWFAVGTNWAVNRGLDAVFWAGQFTMNRIHRIHSKFNSDQKLGALKDPLDAYRAAPAPAGAAHDPKYDEAVELMAFWDFLTTGAVVDISPARKHSAAQKDFTDSNPFPAYIPSWQGRNGY
jgi:hypothetical protein